MVRVGKRNPGKYDGEQDHLGMGMWNNSRHRMIAGASDGAVEEITAANGLKQRGIFPGMRYAYRDTGHTQDSVGKFMYHIFK